LPAVSVAEERLQEFSTFTTMVTMNVVIAAVIVSATNSSMIVKAEARRWRFFAEKRFIE
jgi:hypothetical protein